MKKIIIFSTAVLGFNLAANAQATSSANQNVALSLSNAISITFTGSGTSTGGAVSIPFTTVSDYTNGVTSSGQQLKVQSNKVFNVTVNANAANFTYSGTTSPAPVMPVSNLNIMVTNNNTGGTIAGSYGSSYNDLTTTPATILTNCTNGGNQLFEIKYQATPGFSYPAGTYTTNVVFTATQP